MRPLVCAVAILGLAVMGPSRAIAQAAPKDAGSNADAPTTSIALRTSIKTSLLPFRAPDAPALFPQRTGVESVSRVRFEPEVRVGERMSFEMAYEHRVRYRSTPAGLAASGVLPSDAVTPFRVRPLDWSLSQSSRSVWRHEIDRATARVHAGAADVTAGRQAIGWGRGVMFGAVDLFAPFSPLEADREWRRGVDAVRADVKLTDRSSIDLVAAFGPSWDRSAAAARVRGYAGTIDVEVMAGRRGRDLFGGLTSSAAVGDAEVHVELAAFRLPGGEPLYASRLRWKGVLGGSWRFPIGAGVLAYGEYHYSGFGAERAEDVVPMLLDPSFRERYLRGDTQILSRHAVAALLSYEASTETTYSGQWIHNPGDGSGILAPGITFTASDQVSLLGTLYVPYGRAPLGQSLRSEYGASALAGLFQLRVYL